MSGFEHLTPYKKQTPEKKKKPMLISIDFDGTIVHHKFPKIGKSRPYAFQVMKKLQKMGHRLILNTCREDEGYNIEKQYLSEAVAFCKANGVEFVSHNCNADEDEFRHPELSLSRKVYATMYIDDRNFGGFPGWEEVAKFFNISLEEENE